MPVAILKRLLLASVVVLSGCSQTSETVSIDIHVDKQWHEFTHPLNHKPTIAGGYANGCIDGAKALPLDGEGHVVMRLSRNRFYGHPQLIQFVTDLSDYSASLGRKMLIGDLSQPRGGPMNYGHSSHQIGLDVDIWLQTISRAEHLSTEQREQREFVTMVDKQQGVMLPGRWRQDYTKLLRRTALDERVARIFVNPIIKQHLCNTQNQAAWLHKLRPWWGHDAHFHVRLHCPQGMSGCKPQSLPPAGTGCDSTLNQWIYDQANPKPKDPNAVDKPRLPKILPAFCQTLQRIEE